MQAIASSNLLENSGARHHAYITLKPVKEHKYSLIWIHGLTMDATGFLKEFLDPELKLAPENCKVILPTAEFKKMDCLNGKTVHSWYNKYKWQSFESQDEELANYSQDDIKDSVGVISNLID